MDYSRQIDKLIDVYYGWLSSTDTDAGWHAPGQLQRWIEFKGDVPAPSGNDQADLKMIKEVQYLRNEHVLLRQAKELIGRLKPNQRTALLYSWRYVGSYNADTGRTITSKQVATFLGIGEGAFKQLALRARRNLARWLEADEVEAMPQRAA